MRKASVNIIIDTVAFVAFILLTATGVLVRYVLPPGSGHFSTLWGMDRHQWGALHFWIAVVLLAALGFHLFLHWRWIIFMVKGKPREGSGSRAVLSIVGVVALLGLAVAPFLGPIEKRGDPPHRMYDAGPAEHSVSRINGSMTLEEVEQITGVPAQAIMRELGLPAGVSPQTRLGRLRRECGFEMYDVREIARRQREEGR